MITRTAPSWHTEDWQIQLSNSITSVQTLLDLVQIKADQLPAQLQAHQSFPIRVPQAFAAKIETGNPNDPLLLQVLPQAQELIEHSGYTTDPLQESQFTPVPGLIHKYRSRVLLTTSSACAVNCRYCFRRHFPYLDNRISHQQLSDIVEYLNKHPEVNEIIFSGGDPLAISNSRLESILAQLETLPHITRVRIHTRFPVVIPQRIDQALLNLIESSRFKWIMVVHSNHANELDGEFDRAMGLLQDRKVSLLNQSVLLKGINTDTRTLTNLSERLFQAGVLPYYLHLLDPVAGAAHFNIPKTDARRIYSELMAQLPGFLTPKLVKETPEAPSKTPITL